MTTVTRKGLAAASKKLVAMSEKVAQRAAALVDMCEDESAKDARIVSTASKVNTAMSQLEKANAAFAEKAEGFSNSESEKTAKPERAAKAAKAAKSEKPVKGEKPAKRGRKPKAEAEETVTEKPRKKKRAAKEETVTEKPAKKTRKPKAKAEEDDIFGDDIFDEKPAKAKKGAKKKKNK